MLSKSVNTGLPAIPPSAIGDLSNASIPVWADLASVDRPHHIDVHSHLRGQFIYASHGTLQIATNTLRVVVPPQFAMWIPPNVEHAVTAGMPIEYCSLFVDPSACDVMPTTAQLLHLNNLLKELTWAVAACDQKQHNAKQLRLNAVILDQLQTLKSVRVALPMPVSARLQKLVAMFLEYPANTIDLEQLAQHCSVSRRNLTRMFQQECGMSIGQWLQHLKVLKAIERLELGEPVKTIAFELGYQQPSAFIAMFKRITGESPTEYLSH